MRKTIRVHWPRPRPPRRNALWRSLDPGWATLFAAVLGVLAVGLTAYFGLKSVEHSSRENLRALIAATERQAELDRVTEEERRRRASSTLARAFMTEILEGLRLQMGREIGARDHPDLPIASLLPALSHPRPIYEANAGRIGELHPLCARYVVLWYSFATAYAEMSAALPRLGDHAVPLADVRAIGVGAVKQLSQDYNLALELSDQHTLDFKP